MSVFIRYWVAGIWRRRDTSLIGLSALFYSHYKHKKAHKTISFRCLGATLNLIFIFSFLAPFNVFANDREFSSVYPQNPLLPHISIVGHGPGLFLPENDPEIVNIMQWLGDIQFDQNVHLIIAHGAQGLILPGDIKPNSPQGILIRKCLQPRMREVNFWLSCTLGEDVRPSRHWLRAASLDSPGTLQLGFENFLSAMPILRVESGSGIATFDKWKQSTPKFFGVSIDSLSKPVAYMPVYKDGELIDAGRATKQPKRGIRLENGEVLIPQMLIANPMDSVVDFEIEADSVDGIRNIPIIEHKGNLGFINDGIPNQPFPKRITSFVQKRMPLRSMFATPSAHSVLFFAMSRDDALQRSFTELLRRDPDEVGFTHRGIKITINKPMHAAVTAMELPDHAWSAATQIPYIGRPLGWAYRKCQTIGNWIDQQIPRFDSGRPNQYPCGYTGRGTY